MRFLADIARALRQLDDPVFQKVVAKGIGYTVLLLVAVYALLLALLDWALPDSVRLPWIGAVSWVDDLASGASILLMLVASVFLMVPVAAAVMSLFLDDVTDAVESRHYPALPRAPRLPLSDALRDGLGALAVLVAANLVALVAYLVFPPFAPVIFVALNGYLLGREYFLLIAARRLGRVDAQRMRRRHKLRVWAAGAVMALPLVIPVVNLLVPVLGAAAFTHLFHRLPPLPARAASGPSGRTHRGRAH